MGINELTQQLIDSRLMITVEEFETFENVSAKIIELKDINHIPNLCMGFHDETECHEVMFGLIHGIEYYGKIFDKKEYLSILMKSTSLMFPHAKDWFKEITIRILLNEKTFKIYKEVIKELEIDIKDKIIFTLFEIKKDYSDDNRFDKQVDEIILYLNSNN